MKQEKIIRSNAKNYGQKQCEQLTMKEASEILVNMDI